MRRIREIAILAASSAAVVGLGVLAQPMLQPDYTIVGTELVCRYDSFAPGYETFIQYKNRRGEVVFESAAAGRCTP